MFLLVSSDMMMVVVVGKAAGGIEGTKNALIAFKELVALGIIFREKRR